MSKESKGYKNMPKKIYIRTFGCQMNIRDSEVICGLLRNEGYRMTDKPDTADIIIFNTCSVRQHAEDKVWSEIGRVNKQGSSNKRKIIGLVGCMAQNYQDGVFQRAPSVDFVVGPTDIDKIPAIVKSLSTIEHRLSTRNLFEKKIWETDSLNRPEEIYHTGYYQDKKHAYIVISEGCSNYCSYCVVPYVRGELRNRNYAGILKEIETAVDNGITSVTLLGQNVNAYQSSALRHQSSVDFRQLLRMVDDIKGLEEFSFVTSHPKDTTSDLFKAMVELKKLKKYLHLPIQSGSDKILELMNRGYTRKYYLDLVENYRRIVKGGSLSTDIIVGFPGESQDDFLATYALLKEIKFDSAYIFKYSLRPHTPAQRLVDDVTRAEKEKRHKLVLDLQKEISRKCLKN